MTIIVLTFEGCTSQQAVLDFYNGGLDGAGAGPGPNYGIAFGPDTLAATESDPAANFSQQPEPGETIMFFLTGSGVLNVPAGFEFGFSFRYTTVGDAADVFVYEGLNATGTLLGTIHINALGFGPDPENAYSNWATGALALGPGVVARSIDFGGTVNQVGYDNITFGSIVPIVPPELTLSATLDAVTSSLSFTVTTPEPPQSPEGPHGTPKPPELSLSRVIPIELDVQ